MDQAIPGMTSACMRLCMMDQASLQRQDDREELKTRKMAESSELRFRDQCFCSLMDFRDASLITGRFCP